jgi:hypothetical protein
MSSNVFEPVGPGVHDWVAALDDRPRPGKEPTITAGAKAWLVDLACRKAKELGYPHELWSGCWLVTRANMAGRLGATAWPALPGATYARFSTGRR